MEYTKKKNWIIAIAVAIVYLTIRRAFQVLCKQKKLI